MGNYYEITKSVRITTSDPIDGDRYIADTIAVRDSLVSNNRAHNGLQVYVKDTIGDGSMVSKLYILIDKDDSPALWKEISTGETVEGDKHKEFIQSAASSNWVIQHNLDKIPSVTVIGSDNKIVICEIEHIDKNNLNLIFNAPFAGKAYMN